MHAVNTQIYLFRIINIAHTHTRPFLTATFQIYIVQSAGGDKNAPKRALHCCNNLYRMHNLTGAHWQNWQHRQKSFFSDTAYYTINEWLR